MPRKGAEGLRRQVPPPRGPGRPVHRDLKDVRRVVPLHREGQGREGEGPRPLRHGRQQVGDDRDRVPHEDVQAPAGLRTRPGEKKEVRRAERGLHAAADRVRNRTQPAHPRRQDKRN